MPQGLTPPPSGATPPPSRPAPPPYQPYRATGEKHPPLPPLEGMSGEERAKEEYMRPPEIPTPPKPGVPLPSLPPLPVERGKGTKWIWIVLIFIIFAGLIGIGFFIYPLFFRKEAPVVPSPSVPAEEPSGPSLVDTDKDGLPDADEAKYGTNSLNNDTDGDGYLDGEEVEAGYDPLKPGSAQLDSDKDGLGDADEKKWGTDPHNPDTDGDGYSDGAEVKAGHNPLKKAPDDKL